MNTMLRRRAMFASGGVTPTPVFYDYLHFDGTAYIDTDYTLPSGCSIRCYFGNEATKASQSVFTTEGGGGYLSFCLGGNTTSTKRQLVPYYDSSSALATTRTLDFSFAEYALFMTQNRFGYGTTNYAYTKGNLHPSGGISFGRVGSLAKFSGTMRTFYVYGSETSAVGTYAGFDNYTPVATFRPCTYYGEAGLWLVESGQFYGNTAVGGTLTVSNI